MPENPAPPPQPAHDDEALDEALDETFPASDPIAVGEIEGAEDPPYMAADPSRPSSESKLAWAALHAFLWSVVWIALDHSSEVADLVCGIVVAIASVALVRRLGRVAGPFGARPSWIANFRRIPVNVFRDTARVLAHAWRSEAGVAITIPFEAGGDDPRSRGRRALVVMGLSTAPNTMVCVAPPEDRQLRVHFLLPPFVAPSSRRDWPLG